VFALASACLNLDGLAFAAVKELPRLQGFDIALLNGNLGLLQVRHKGITILSRLDAAKPPAISLADNILVD